MAKKKIIILGAGLAGLSAAWHLQRRGIDCLIFEKEPEVGGLCRSKKIKGFTFDYGGHLLHFKKQYAFNLVKSLLKDNLQKYDKNAWVYSHQRFIKYPFQANLYGLPPNVAKECVEGFINASHNNLLKKKANLNFLEWINSAFGRGIARHFMIPYNTKFWTLPPEELTCEWLDGLIPKPTLSQILKGAEEKNRKQPGYNACFWYPKNGGINQLPRALAKQVKNINTEAPIAEINLAKKEIKLASGSKEKFDCLISTIPLPELKRVIQDIPATLNASFNKLRWNSIINLNLGVEKKDHLKRHWIYFPEKRFSFFRVGFFHNFSYSITPQGKSSLYAEVSYSRNKPIDKRAIIFRIKHGLNNAGIVALDDKICVQNINDIQYGYPIYDKNYSPARTKILDFLSQNNIFCCGRYGSWRYMSMEDAILDARQVSGQIKK
jgi:protoporphyrinogen oxidase